jgi:HAD superfamily 5'-nucleotidase-like hydrolase
MSPADPSRSPRLASASDAASRDPARSAPLPVASDDSVAAPASREALRAELLALLGNVVREQDVPRKNKVFVNRNLRMDEIDLIGFDMDYTLAIYNQPRIEALSVACTLQKLVQNRGYPDEILGLDYDPAFAIRGLVVDRRYGNIFKMDRYGHVGRVYHGRAKLEKEERRRLYRLQRIRLSSPRYAWIDTLFALPEAVMFARIVEMLESKPGRVRYARLWQDIRDSIDEAHRDDSIKCVIKAELDRYLVRDPDLAPTLHKFRSSGKRLFVLTNSLWDYTDRVMSYLLDGQLTAYPSWRHYFDAIIVGGAKPAFFTERRPFVELDANGHEKGPVAGPLLRGRIYQGGNILDFESMMGGAGDRVLYIGDHIYGDMLRAKKSSVWRTAMIVQELEEEIVLQERLSERIRRIEEQERRRIRLDSELTYQQLVLRSLQRLEQGQVPPAGGVRVDEATLAGARAEAKHKIEELKRTIVEVGDDVEQLEEEIDRAFNPWWGPIFKEGVENSRFGEQVEDYACVYTSRVSNFLAYSPLQYFRSPRDHMPHELY